MRGDERYFMELYTLIEKNALCDQIANRIEQMILSDITQASEKLPSEQALAAGFGVSRSVIREALTILKARGLVSPKQGEGSYITVPHSVHVMDTVNRFALMKHISMHDISAVRVHLETMAARLAAENITSEELNQLEALNKEMERKKTDLDKRVEIDLKFHLLIATFSKNKMLKVFIQSLNSLVAPMLRRSLFVPMANEDGVQYHNRIISALRSGDADISENIIREHLMLFIRNYEESLKMETNDDFNGEKNGD